MSTAPENPSGDFAVIPQTADIKPLTRKVGRKVTEEKTTAMKIVETTRIGIPLAAIAVILCTAVGLLYTSIMTEIAKVSATVKAIQEETADKSKAIIELKVREEYREKRLSDMESNQKIMFELVNKRR